MPLRAVAWPPRLEGVGNPLITAPELSIIVPSFNEEQRLPASLEKIADYIRNKRPNTEVLVVDDGSTDRTAAVAEILARSHSRLARDTQWKQSRKGI